MLKGDAFTTFSIFVWKSNDSDYNLIYASS